jgi:hypothetical protein
VSKALLLLRDYKACQEINERLEHRIYIYEEKVRADQVTINQADSVIMVQDTIINDLSNENYELEQDVTKLKKRRKWWFFGGLATGLSVFLLFVF